MVLSGDAEKVKPGSHKAVDIVQKDPKDKDSESDSFVYLVSLHDSVVCTRLLEKVLSPRSPIAIYLTCLKETSL